MEPTPREDLPTANPTPAPDADAAEGPPITLQQGSPVNVFLIVASVVLTLWTGFGADQERLALWLIGQFPADSPARFLEIRHGEIWRLLTPTFLHFSPAHLGFNTLNMLMLGNLLERRLRSWHYLSLTCGIALVSNFGQYVVYGNPGFGGLSGVVYGLIGYVGLRGRYDPTFGLEIPRETLVLALVWFAFCFTPWAGHIANGVHAVGLILGAAWGYADGRSALQRLRAVTSAVL